MPVIHYITPFCDGNIGKGINDTIQYLPEADWVCLRDQDTLLFRGSGELIQDIVERNSDYALIGCMMNRLNIKSQLAYSHFSDDFNLVQHGGIFDEFKREGSVVIQTADDIAGAFMLFPKTTWTQVGGFLERSIIFDRKFTRSARNIGKVGIATGLYIFHLYRMNSLNPTDDITHLNKCR